MLHEMYLKIAKRMDNVVVDINELNNQRDARLSYSRSSLLKLFATIFYT